MLQNIDFLETRCVFVPNFMERVGQSHKNRSEREAVPGRHETAEEAHHVLPQVHSLLLI